MVRAYFGQRPVRIAVLAALSIGAFSAHADTCPDERPDVTITSPNDGYTTSDATVDVSGEVRGLCALSELSCGTSAERISVRSQFVPLGDRVWKFECTGVELDLADVDPSLSNQIVVAASGFGANGGPVSAEGTVDVIHQRPPVVEPPGDDGFPVLDYYTKSKVTWNHRNDLNPYYDAFSTSARLGYPDGQALPMPCAPDDSVTVTLYGPDPAQPLLTESFSGSDWGTCTDNRLRTTGQRGGVREISFDRRSGGEDTFYVYWERVEYGPSDMAYVRSIDSYLLHVSMVSSGQPAEWLINIGPECLNFEEFYAGSGEEARTVVRCNR